MMIDSQANAQQIQKLYEDAEVKESEIEKLMLEATVVVTEKTAMKRELDRIDVLYNQLQKDFRE